MFPDNQRLSALTELNFAEAMPWGPPDLDRLVSSCCQLERLSLCCSPGLELTPLLQLAVLKRLYLRGVTKDSTVASLVQLSALQSLQELIVVDPCRFTNCHAIKSLTALTQLARFGLSGSYDIFSTTVRQQRLQQFDLQKVSDDCASFYVITNTVSASGLGCVLSGMIFGSLGDILCFQVLLACQCMLVPASLNAWCFLSHKPTARVPPA